MGTVRNLEQLCGRLVSDIRRMEANWSIPSGSTGLSSSLGTRDDPLVLDDEEDEVVVRIEREDTVVPPPRAGTPFVARAAMVTTLIEVDEDVDPNDILTDQSIDAMEDQFMIRTGVMVHRGRRIAWPPLDLEDEVVESSVVGEGEEVEIVRDFAGEEEQQRLQDLDDAALFEQSATLQVELISNDPAPEFGVHPPPYEE